VKQLKHVIQEAPFPKGSWPQPVERRRWFSRTSDLDEGDCYLYFIEAGPDGPVKIGMTHEREVSRRLLQLQTASPVPLHLLGTIGPTWPSVEKKVHALLRPHCVRGEWFDRVPSLAVLHRFEQGNLTHYATLSSVFTTRLFYVEMQVLRPDDDQPMPLEVAVLYSLKHALLDKLNGVNTDNPLPLRAWLATQLQRTDALADLVYEAMHDVHFPAVGNLETYLHYVNETIPEDAALPVLLDAWIESDRAIIALLEPPDIHDVDFC